LNRAAHADTPDKAPCVQPNATGAQGGRGPRGAGFTTYGRYDLKSRTLDDDIRKHEEMVREIKANAGDPLGFATGIANASGIVLVVVFSSVILIYGYRWIFAP
jgi:hypothetical protein